jgi:hypothetical protein
MTQPIQPIEPGRPRGVPAVEPTLLTPPEREQERRRREQERERREQERERRKRRQAGGRDSNPPSGRPRLDVRG